MTIHAITDQRQIQEDGQLLKQVLEEWQGMPCDEANWESWTELIGVFPDVNLQDKVIFN